MEGMWWASLFYDVIILRVESMVGHVVRMVGQVVGLWWVWWGIWWVWWGMWWVWWGGNACGCCPLVDGQAQHCDKAGCDRRCGHMQHLAPYVVTVQSWPI